MFYTQSDYNIRCEWGAAGIANLAPLCDAIIIVDVLSFSTCIDIAVTRGAIIYPYAWSAKDLDAYAASLNAQIAGPNRSDTGRFTLSPSSLLNIQPGTRLVLPSPNGSTLSMMTGDKPTFAGCIRNAQAVAEAAMRVGKNLLIVPAGERWPDGTIRPALEDLIGAGAIIRHMADALTLSPEAQTAMIAYGNFAEEIYATLRECSSGKELIERGFTNDIDLAANLNISTSAPRLIDGAYRRG
ncbi:MAG: 2-phosphosulfolactate phosphatase [Chloroflexia bacterium]